MTPIRSIVAVFRIGALNHKARNQPTCFDEAPKAIARPWTYEEDPRGTLSLVADRELRVLVGAWAVAPLAGEWIHQASQAIRAEIPLEKLLDSVAQFPTYSEAYLEVLEKLDI